ncbi:MAG: hypothetical protein LBS90_00025 [Oscillospiraceae bacterium]|jgi:hypothetical protein|nr:hypothetical protein [Oscillospiraceae bacterium]
MTNDCRAAVFANADGELCDFFDAERFLVFSRDGGEWRNVREERFERVRPAAPAVLRPRVTELLGLIDDCEILAGLSLAGIAFTVFDMAGKRIFAVESIEDAVFDGMLADIGEAGAEADDREDAIEAAKPVALGGGVYSLDLAELQTKYPEVSSKQALREFLQSSGFAELRLRCRHVPPWIEAGGYEVSDEQRSGGAVFAVIRNKRNG